MTRSNDQLSDLLCQHVARTTYADLPETTRDAARRVLLDATGVMLAASGLSEDIRPFVAIARASGGQGPCSILGFDDRVSAPMAAFANGAMGHALDFEDAFDPAPSHPNAAAIPAALAIAQSCGPVHGAELLTAVAVGCDLVCRLGLSLRQPLEDGGWYPPPILGAFGATAAAARMLRLPAGKIRDALSLALCQATAPGEIMHSRRTVVRAVREAFPAQAAVTAALLAREGVAGFEAPLEGEAGFFRLYAGGHYDPADLLGDLGGRYHIERLSFKPWPACRGTHAYIEIALRLAAAHRIAWQDIHSVTVVTGPVQRMLLEPHARKCAPETIIDARFSIPFTLAMALVRGHVDLEDFRPEALADPQILSMAARVVAREQPDWGREQAASGALSITLRDGRVLSGQVDHALGNPEAPMTTARLVEKFIACCGQSRRSLARADAAALAERILRIDAAPDCGAVFAL